MTSAGSSNSGNNAPNLSPRANVFLLVNLGCEMLYVVDQRLKSQKISAEKSFQVVHDITTVMLEPKFIDSIIMGSTSIHAQLITDEHCKFMLKDAATCSLMRLDECSMDKLWNLMTMLFKWQLFISKHPHHLIDITFRHLNEIAKIQPDPKRKILIEFTKNKLLDFWNALDEQEQLSVYQTSIAWLQFFNTKISVLIRLGFQTLDGHFVRQCDAKYFQEFVDTIGDNVYEKSLKIAAKERANLNENVDILTTTNTAKYDVNQLAEMLNCHSTSNDATDSADAELKPIDATNFQKLFVKNLQQCNILFEDFDLNGRNPNGMGMAGKLEDNKLLPEASNFKNYGEFVKMNTVYNRENNFNASEGTYGVPATTLTKDLLEYYSKMK